MVTGAVERFSVWQVNLNPTKGSDQAGYRPVLVLSPAEMNQYLNTVIVAPMTTRQRGWPSLVSIHHQGKDGEVALDQIRTLDKSRLLQEMGMLEDTYHERVLEVIAEMFLL
jgi:mRNA interferase MazF